MKQAAEPFELPISIEPADIDELGHVNNVTYLRWVQDVAVAHWKAASRPSDQATLRWVLLRHEIDYKQAAYLGDGIIARTWDGTASRLRFVQTIEIC
jgi:acyl-CoA thioester hydrolase